MKTVCVRPFALDRRNSVKYLMIYFVRKATKIVGVGDSLVQALVQRLQRFPVAPQLYGQGDALFNYGGNALALPERANLCISVVGNQSITVAHENTWRIRQLVFTRTGSVS